MRVVLASRNAGKIRELQTMLAPLTLTLESLEAHELSSADETGLTFIENAIIKARAAAAATGLAALADDSGLVVPALRGAPGIYSARYASSSGDAGADQDPGARDAANNRRLIAELRGVANRAAYFYCAIVLLRHASDPTPVIATAQWHGRIIDVPRGTHGFGYDPHFFLAELEKTSAELPPEQKNALSHRGQAIAKLVVELSNL